MLREGSFDIFSYSGPRVIFGSDKNRLLFKLVLGGMRIVDLSVVAMNRLNNTKSACF